MLSALAVTVGYTPPAGHERPKITDWMQAWGSVAAVMAGLLAALAAAALLQHELTEARAARDAASAERAEAEQERAAHRTANARAVATRRPRIEIKKDDEGPDYVMVKSFRIKVVNFGATPITKVEMLVSGDGEDFFPEGPSEVSPGDNGAEFVEVFDVPERYSRTILARQNLSVRLWFTDSQQLRWMIKDNGAPTEQILPNPKGFDGAVVVRRTATGQDE